MPRTLKRRSDAISRDSPPASPSPEPPTRSKPPSTSTAAHRPPQRQPSRSPSPASSTSSISSADDPQTQDPSHDAATQQKTLVKKLVRLALATEYARQPLRRTDVSAKIFKDTGSSGRKFNGVFADAQKVLGETFGMRLVELPGREKWGLKERRREVASTQIEGGGTQRKKGGKGEGGGGGESQVDGKGGKAWILTSILPEDYKRDKRIVQPSSAGGGEVEAGYTGLYTFLVTLVYLNGNELSEGKMEKYLERVNVGMTTELGPWEKVLARMVREGYLDRRKEDGEGWVYVVGPRGKVEVGVGGVEGLVKGVYGVGLEEEGEQEHSENGNGNRHANRGEKMDEEELNRRLMRSLGVSVGGAGTGREETQEVQEGGVEDVEQPQQQQKRRGRRRKANNNDDEDD